MHLIVAFFSFLSSHSVHQTLKETLAWVFYYFGSLRTSQNSLAGDSDSLFDFPSPVNHLLSKITKVIMYYPPAYMIAFYCTSLLDFVILHKTVIWKLLPQLAEVVFDSSAAHEISICVMSGCWHLPTNQWLHPRHINAIYPHKVTPPICLLWQQPRQ